MHVVNAEGLGSLSNGLNSKRFQVYPHCRSKAAFSEDLEVQKIQVVKRIREVCDNWSFVESNTVVYFVFIELCFSLFVWQLTYSKFCILVYLLNCEVRRV